MVRKLNNLESNTTIAHVKAIFEEHGIPSKLVTGNDTQYISAEFKDFSSTYGFVHITTSPYYPQANGFMERTVQTVKNVFQKCKESGADPHLAMLSLRTAPVNHSIPSPADLLNSRVYQSNLSAISMFGHYCLIWTMFQQSSNYGKIDKRAIMTSLQRLFPLFSQKSLCVFSTLTTANGSLEQCRILHIILILMLSK